MAREKAETEVERLCKKKFTLKHATWKEKLLSVIVMRYGIAIQGSKLYMRQRYI